MPYNFTFLWNLKNNINEIIKQKQTDRYGEQTDGCQMGWGLENRVKRVKGLRSTNWHLQNSHRVVRYSRGSTVNTTLVPMCGTRWVLDYQGDYIINYINV